MRHITTFLTGLGMSLALTACGDAGESPGSAQECLATYIDVSDQDGGCADCTAQGGLTVLVQLVNTCNQSVQFTTASSCWMDNLLLVTESGEERAAGGFCTPSFTNWTMRPDEAHTSTWEWERGNDSLSAFWGALEPGRYRMRLTTYVGVAPVEEEIVVTAE